MAVQGSPRRRLAEDHERHEPAPRRRPFRRPAHDPRRLRPDPRRLTGGLSTRHPRLPSRGSRASDRTVALDARVKTEHNGWGPLLGGLAPGAGRVWRGNRGAAPVARQEGKGGRPPERWEERRVGIECGGTVCITWQTNYQKKKKKN